MTQKKRELDTGLRIGGLTIDPVTGDLITTGNIIVAGSGQLVGAGLGTVTNTGGAGTAASIPLIKLPEATLSYAISGNTIVGASSNSAITINNLGTGNLTISNITVGGAHAADFVVAGCTGNITSNSSCALAVQFIPTAANTRTGTVSMIHNGPDSPTVVQLTAAAILAPIFTISTDNLNFGTANVFTTATQILSVTNTGSADLNISSLTVTGDNATNYTASGCFSAVAPGTSCAISVNFRPTFNTVRTANLTIAHNGLTSPAVVSLTGTGTGTVTLGDWTYQDDLSRSATVYGTSDTPVTIWSPQRAEFFVAGTAGSATSPDGVTWTYNSNLSTVIPTPQVGIWAAELNAYLVVGAAPGSNQGARSAISSDGVTWTVGTVNGPGSYTTFNDIAWSGSMFVVTAQVGGIYTSTNGLTWTYKGSSQIVSGMTGLYAVTWTGSKFVIGGAGGYMAESTDGTTWTNMPGLRNNATWGSNGITTIAWNGSIYFVGNGIITATSTDGATWSARSNNFSPNRRAVWSVTQAQFVGVHSSYWYVFRSSDGVTWTQTNLPGWPTTTGSGVADIAWSGSKYLVTNGVGSASDIKGKVATSSDGTTWTYQDGLSQSNTVFGRSQINSIVFSQERAEYLAVGGPGRVATSPDGATWTYRSGLISTAWNTNTTIVNAATWNGTQYLVAGYSGKIATSPDGATWTYRSGLSSAGWTSYIVNALAWSGTQYVAAGTAGRVATSPDGITWTNRTGLSSTAWGTTGVTAMTWNGSQYIVGGDSGKIATSPDGITWTYQAGLSATTWGTSSSFYVNSIVWNGSQYLAAGGNARVATSPDGVTWAYQDNLRTASWAGIDVTAVVWNGAMYVAAGTAGKVAISFDGVSWVDQPALSTTTWGTTTARALVQTGTISNAKYVVVGNNGKVAINVAGA